MMMSNKSRTWQRNIIGVLKFCALLPFAHICTGQACPVQNKQIEITINGKTLAAEVAADLESHTCGLAFRHDLPPDQGMLFVFDTDQRVGFWMKDTYIHLSIAFMDVDGKILEIHNMDPGEPTRRYISRTPIRYALEVKQGWFKTNRIEVGDRAVFDLHTNPDVYRYTPGQ